MQLKNLLSNIHSDDGMMYVGVYCSSGYKFLQCGTVSPLQRASARRANASVQNPLPGECIRAIYPDTE